MQILISTKGFTHSEILVSADELVLPTPTSSKVFSPAARLRSTFSLAAFLQLFLSVGPSYLHFIPLIAAFFFFLSAELSLSIFVCLLTRRGRLRERLKGNCRVFGVIEATGTDSEKPIMSPPSLFSSDTDQDSFLPSSPGLFVVRRSLFLGTVETFTNTFRHDSPKYPFEFNECN